MNNKKIAPIHCPSQPMSDALKEDSCIAKDRKISHHTPNAVLIFIRS